MTARGDIESYGTLKEVAPVTSMKCIVMETASSFVGGTDTFTVDLTKHGGLYPVAIFATYQSAAGATLAASTASTTTSSGTVTVSTAASGTGQYGVVLYFK
jgi:hypothetical protein